MSRLRAGLGVRAGEERLAGWLLALFAVTQAGHGIGSNTGDALFFVRYGVEHLPAMIAVSGLTAMAAILAYQHGLGRLRLRRILPATALGAAGLLVIQRLAILSEAPVIYPVIWLTEQAVILVTFTLMWNAAAEACDARQSKRLFPLFASAGIAGGVVGNFTVGPAAHLLGTENLLLVHAALLVGVAALAAGVAGRFLPSTRPLRRSAAQELRAGWSATAGSPLLRLVALAAGALSLLFFLVVFPFAEQVTASFESDADVAAFLGVFSGVATAASFLVSLLLANRLFAWLGVVGVLMIVPGVYLAGFGLWAGSFTLATAAAVRGAQWVAVNGLGATAWTSVFNVVGPGRRGAVLAFITAVPTQLGTIASGALLIAGPRDPRGLALVGALLAGGLLVVVWRMRSAYGAALMAAIRRGIDVLAAAPGLRRWASDADTVRALVTALDSPSPGVRRVGVTLLGRAGAAAAGERDRLRAALADADPAVRRAAVHAVADCGAFSVDELGLSIGDPDPRVRAAAASRVRDGLARAELAAMAAADPDELVEASLDALVAWPDAAADIDLTPLLERPSPRIRLGAADVMLRAQPKAGVSAALALLSDRDSLVRSGAARLLAGRPEAEDRLLELLETGSMAAQEAAARALADCSRAAPALASWAQRQTERAVELRRRRAALASSGELAGAAYLRRVLAQRELASERRALVAIESLAGAETAQLLSRGVHARDPQLRAQAVEALDVLADRRLSAQLIPLLEQQPAFSPEDGTLSELLSDADVWLRALAARCLAEAADGGGAGPGARDDPTASAILTVDENGDAMSEQIGGAAMVDRVLLLQQVPMFSELEPEDLSLIAELCQPRVFDAEEVIYTMGEPGDEMLIIGEGRVRISVPSADGARVLRRYGPGEHVGELAVLRGMPRVADVIAEESVSGLVVGSGELRSILASRPEVAMAMLGTLAERLGTIA